MKLYEIENEIKAILDIDPDENGELNIDYDALDGLEMEKSQKLENMIKYYKSVIRDVQAFKAEEKELAARRKALENKGESLKSYLDLIHSGEKAEYGVHKISYRKSEKIIEGDMSELPGQCIVVEHKPMKSIIKKELKNGTNIPGWAIETKMNIQIK